MERTPRTESKRARRLAAIAAVALLLIVPAFVTHGSVRLARERRYVASRAPSHRMSFDAVLREGTRVSLCTLRTGVVHVPRADMLRRDHGTSDRANERVPLPIFAHLIRHPSRGDVLVDTGLDASFVHDELGNLSMPARIVHGLIGARFVLPRGEDVRSQLAALDARPRIAFFTHVHGDHTAGVPALPRRMRLVAGEGETRDVAAYLGYGHVGADRIVETIRFHDAPGLSPFEHVVDLFGDGSVLAIATPGHSEGHTSYFVSARTGPVLLIGDASHTRWAFEHGIGPRGPTEADEIRGQHSLDALRAFAAAHPDVELVFGHEAGRLRCELRRD